MGSWREWELLVLPAQFFCEAAVAAAKSLQLCPTMCDSTDGSPPGFSPWDSPGKNTAVGYHFRLLL